VQRASHSTVAGRGAGGGQECVGVQGTEKPLEELPEFSGKLARWCARTIETAAHRLMKHAWKHSLGSMLNALGMAQDHQQGTHMWWGPGCLS
jgi:hypothetical protein